jgi:hypothetical protein
VGDEFRKLHAEVELLKSRIAELTAQNTFIRREAATAAPGTMESGAIVPMDDGTNSRLYMQFPSGLKSVTFT